MKRAGWIAAAIVVAGGAFGIFEADKAARVGAGYKTKIACSEIFVANRAQEDVLDREFDGVSPILDRIKLRINAEKRSVSGSIYGFGRSKAVYRDGYGCTLVRGGAPEAIPALNPVNDRPLSAREDDPNVDYAALNAALDTAFADGQAPTRAILVVKDGAVIAERYADGFTADTPFLSWSMAKSVTASMVGAAVLRGLIDIDAPAPVPEWEDDARGAITWNDLLQMQSGLAWTEQYGDVTSDVTRMLFRKRDAGKVAARKKLAHEPGAFWSYSSGTTNLVQRALRRALEAQGAGYHAFARETLFGPLGAASFVMEPDSSGTVVGSSFMYATARDWAKLGLLYLNGGVAGGERLLPGDWSDYVSTPALKADGQYGAHFWLNRPGASGRDKFIPGVPDDAYLMAGHEGQYVLIIPDKNLVVVRTGMTRDTEPMPRVAPTFAAIYAAVR